MRGGSGSDDLSGGDGADVLIGGGAGDFLLGGGGADRFIIDEWPEDSAGAADIVYDFDRSDLVDISKVDADLSTDGDQAFVLVDHLSGSAGEAMLLYDRQTGRTELWLNDGSAEPEVVVIFSTKHVRADEGHFVL